MKEEKTMIVSGSHMMIMMVRQKINVVKQGESIKAPNVQKWS